MSKPIQNQTQSMQGVAEISISEIFEFLKTHTLRLFLISFVCAIIGYILSYTMQRSYRSYITLLPETSASSNPFGSFSGLARLGGLNRSENNGALQPELYPSVLQTVPFALYMMRQPVSDQNNQKYISLEQFLKPDTTQSFFGKLLFSSPKKKSKDQPKIAEKNILSLSTDQERNVAQILSKVVSSYDTKTGIIRIEAEMSDPIVAAQSVEASTSYLIGYISDYRTSKTAREVLFLEQRVKEAKKREQQAEFALQNYRDSNRSPFLNVARIEEQRLQSDYLLAQSLYSELVRKWEEAKIKLKDEQPVIKVLEPPKIYYSPVKPRRIIVSLIFATLGGAIGLIVMGWRTFRIRNHII